MTSDAPDRTQAMRASPAKARPLINRLLGIFGLIGGALLIAALVLTVREWRFLATSEHAAATVSRIEREWMQGSRRSNGSTGPGNTGYRVVAIFRAPDGTSVEARSSGVTSYTSYRVGDAIEVDYPPGRPGQAQLARFVDRWLVALVLGGIGTGMLAMCGFAIWLMRQPGMRVISNGLGGFGIRSASPVIHIDGGSARSEATRPELSMIMDQLPPPDDVASRPRWLRLAAVLVVGVGIELIAARVTDRRGERSGTSVASGNDSATNDAPQPGYPPHLTVKAPPMTDNGKERTSGWLDTGNGGATPGTMTMAARAFLARPQQDAAMQAALRAQVARLGLDCPTIVFVPDETLVIASPAAVFEQSGTLQRGLIRQRFLASGCPGHSRQFNIWISAPGGGAPIRTVAGFPGTTRASVTLMRDATPIASALRPRRRPVAGRSLSPTRICQRPHQQTRRLRGRRIGSSPAAAQ